MSAVNALAQADAGGRPAVTREMVMRKIVVGGKRLLEGDFGQMPLKLVDSQTFDTGVLHLAHVPADR